MAVSLPEIRGPQSSDNWLNCIFATVAWPMVSLRGATTIQLQPDLKTTKLVAPTGTLRRFEYWKLRLQSSICRVPCKFENPRDFEASVTAERITNTSKCNSRDGHQSSLATHEEDDVSVFRNWSIRKTTKFQSYFYENLWKVQVSFNEHLNSLLEMLSCLLGILIIRDIKVHQRRVINNAFW